MIKINELRVGNILNYDTGEGIVPDFIDAEDLVWLTGNPDRFNKYHSKIELSEEWLIKFGFEKRKANLTYFIKDGLTIIVRVTEFAFDIGVYDIAVRHVHQLQNLYYALTGTELELQK